MSTKKFALQALAAAVLVVSGSAAHAALTAYTTLASFMSAIASPGVDTFAGFLVGDVTPGPITRNAGVYSYTATTDGNGFYGSDTIEHPSLSTIYSSAPIALSGFAPSVKAIGANFYGTGIDGLFLAGDVMLIATDSTGASLTRTITATSNASFLGFTTTGSITALVMTSVETAGDLWPSIDNLALSAALVPVPEPRTSMLMLAGLTAVGAMVRRRQT